MNPLPRHRVAPGRRGPSDDDSGAGLSHQLPVVQQNRQGPQPGGPRSSQPVRCRQPPRSGEHRPLVLRGEAGRQQEAAALAIRQLIRRFGSVDQASRDLIAALPLPRLEQLAEDLLDFSAPGDLQGWLARNTDVWPKTQNCGAHLLSFRVGTPLPLPPALGIDVDNQDVVDGLITTAVELG